MIVHGIEHDAGVLAEFELPSGEFVRRVVPFRVKSRQYIAKVEVTSPPSAAPLLRQRSPGVSVASTATQLVLPSTPIVGNTLSLVLDTQFGSADGTVLSTDGWIQIASTSTNWGTTTVWQKAVEDDEVKTLGIEVTGATQINALLFEHYNILVGPYAALGTHVSSTSISSGVPWSTGLSSPETSQGNVIEFAIWGSGGSRAGTLQSLTSGYKSIGSVTDNKLVVATRVPQQTGTFEAIAAFSRSHALRAMNVVLNASTPDAVAPAPSQTTRRYVDMAHASLAQPGLPSVPGAPTVLDAVATGEGVTVTWDGVEGATGYNVYANETLVWSRPNIRVAGAIADETGYSRGALLTGLELDEVSLNVSAFNRGGEGDLSVAFPFTVEAPTSSWRMVDENGDLVTVIPKIIDDDGELLDLNMTVVGGN